MLRVFITCAHTYIHHVHMLHAYVACVHYMHACIHTYIQMHIHTHTCAHACTYAYTHFTEPISVHWWLNMKQIKVIVVAIT